MTRLGIGLDFGTTNSALAMAGAEGSPRVATFAARDGETPFFRSVLYVGREDREDPLESAAGPLAIERYLANEGERRLMQSLQSILGSRLYTTTNLFGRTTTLEELIGRIARAVWSEGGGAECAQRAAVVVGRPVRFARAKGVEDDAFAVSRLESALSLAGIERFAFELEPVAAAYHYEQGLDRDELVLIADFGGGTSDFCVLRVGPGARGRARREEDVLGTDGVGIAGDAFDAKLVRHLIAPRLGRGTVHDTLFGRAIPVPGWIYADLERWHHLSFLRSPKTLALLHEIRQGASEPEQISALIHIVERDLGYALYRAIERTKTELSQQEESVFRFDDPPVSIEARVRRAEFEEWIADEVAEIAACVDRLLERTGESEVDRVFMTGGSSFVPAVRRIFEERFGPERLRSGAELTSVASGLALCARDRAGQRTR
ncbi:MAG: Hsp70 family protein [Proteobacteria bacterium]|nr:Hsp70 family protein [Pseudomonadota bacterium]